jgi:hydroxymethylpyrimidine/phosphomethylpyrimidine kinase
LPKNLVSIAGYDPSGGAGILLDILVFEAFGFRGCGVATAVTAQNAVRVERAVAMPARFVAAQFRSISRETSLAGVKVGMVGSLANLQAVTRILSANRGLPRVIDPVFRASSGAALLERRAVPRFLSAIRRKAELVTPNLAEAAELAGITVRTPEEMENAACAIFRASRVPCLVKGGRLKGKAVDVLFDGRLVTVFEHPRLGKSVHGTGCYLSSAILAHLAGGLVLEAACRRGIEATFRAIGRARPAGQGRSVFSFGVRG